MLDESLGAKDIPIRVTHASAFVCEWRCIHFKLGQMNGSFTKTPTDNSWMIKACDQWLQALIDRAMIDGPPSRIDQAINIVEIAVSQAVLTALEIENELLEMQVGEFIDETEGHLHS